MITETIKGHELYFESNAGCFSPRYVDKGTLAMLSFVDFGAADKILDLGCGYGVVGILAAKFTAPENVFLTDVCKSALQCARLNAILNKTENINIIESDGYKNLEETGFDLILSNPPYNSDFSVAKMFIEKGFNRLRIGGRLYMVTKRKEWYKNKFISVFGGVKIHEKDGYYVFEAEKRNLKYG
ncbi:MAG: methyltransferase [Clostridiales bacterium]|jgi:16S rRNA (guanine1207-N2)-methyltransferase|nr:methyltransferase [Clostridiales bacterium]